MLKSYLVFLSAGRLQCASHTHTHKIDMLLELSSCMSYNSVGHEYNANELTIRYIQKKEEEFIDPYMKLLWEMLE